MRIHRTWLAIVLVAIMAMPMAAADITGKWTASFDTQIGKQNYTYDFVVKAAHQFNVLDARGAIGVTERQRYIGRVRALARAVAEGYIAQREALGFPLLKEGKGAAPSSDAKTVNVKAGKETTP